MNIYPYGHDYGNSETDGKSYYQGSWLTASMPTVEATIDQPKFRQLSQHMAQNSVMIRMAGDETIYLIGEEVLTQKPDAMSHRGYIGRYSSMSSVRALIGNACRMIPEKRFGILVTTGIPVITYVTDERIRENISKGLTGVHTCSITYHRNGVLTTEERVIDIRVNKVVMEGAGAILAHGESGSVRQAVIDIGGGTTDIYTTLGQRPLTDKCNSKEIGVETTIEQLKTNFRSTHGRMLEQGEARDMLLASIGVRDWPTITVKGTTVTAHQQRDIVEEAIRVIGEQIKSFIASTLKEGATSDSVASSIKNVFAIGRGTHFYLPYIKEIISKDQLKLVENPGSDNALGYAMFSKRTLTTTTQIAS